MHVHVDVDVDVPGVMIEALALCANERTQTGLGL